MLKISVDVGRVFPFKHGRHMATVFRQSRSLLVRGVEWSRPQAVHSHWPHLNPDWPLQFSVSDSG